jgi:hypothetical protein
MYSTSNSRDYYKLAGSTAHPILIGISGDMGLGVYPDYALDVLGEVQAIGATGGQITYRVRC